MHDHFSGFKSPSMWAFLAGLLGANFLMVYAEEERWITTPIDHVTASFIGLVVGTVFAVAVLLIQDRFRKKAVQALPHEHHHEHHAHSHEH